MLFCWNETKRQLKDPRARLMYLKEYREEYGGRFWPVELDQKIVGLCREAFPPAGKQSEAMMEQMKEVLDHNKSLAREIQSLNSRVRTLQTDARGDAGGGSGAGPSGGGPRLGPCYRW